MGAAASSHSCRDHGGRLKRVESNDVVTKARCGVCQRGVQVGERIHRCRRPGCTFFLHDGCFRLPVTVKCRFGRTQHRLALGGVDGPAGSCGLCAEPLQLRGARSSEYSCSDAGCGFRVHRRCCNLPQTMHDEELHPHGRLVLRSPSDGYNGGGGGGGRLECLKCGKTPSSRATAWSYQCPKPAPECMDKEICLACVLGSDSSSVACCGAVDPGSLGERIGSFVGGIGFGMGLLVSLAPPQTSDLRCLFVK